MLFPWQQAGAAAKTHANAELARLPRVVEVLAQEQPS